MVTQMDENTQRYIDAKMEAVKSQIEIVNLKVEMMRESFKFVRNTVVGSILSPIVVGIVLYVLLKR